MEEEREGMKGKEIEGGKHGEGWYQLPLAKYILNHNHPALFFSFLILILHILLLQT